MPAEPRIVVTVSGDGTVSAETQGLTGAACLDYITVLEELLGARTVRSAYTEDHHRATADVVNTQELRGVERS
jgi:hypothetical protein